MKTFIIAAVAASFLTTPVLAAPHYGNDNRDRVEQRHDNRGYDNNRDRNDHRFDNRGPQKQQYRSSWNRGERFDYRQARDYRVISSPRNYRLHDAPRGYRWVQSGNDAVLIGITTGLVASVIANSIR